ncbi:MAG: DUF502 domain-containing protein [Dokdonella sp.]|uniref:DUF502 domain-containing protein n=1 Tax=Dokdonella sp. TaxID=2291710 RepID=UPI0025C58DC1|nr:DUF502 domain-containing protein [Dokdonella sp.]MBX3699427.1 DUF502 domain-containing protein [Dokdonella sp.]MCW5579016.1 DUF502 domain-containing protein [Dokdonella sp.]
MRSLHLQRYLFTGLLTIIPLWLTWIVFKWIFALLSEVNLPWITALVNAYPDTLGHLQQEWLLSPLAFLITLVLLYVVGFAASRVLGQRVLAIFERLIEHIPIAHSIYGGAKKLMAMLQNKPGGTQRVVLIAFPSPQLRTIGFVTRVFEDADGVEYAAVYVPTTPNPTGGYLEIVPVTELVATDWSVDQAMAFILSVGATSPDRLPFPLARKP